MLIIFKLIVFQIPCRQGQFLESPIAPFFQTLSVPLPTIYQAGQQWSCYSSCVLLKVQQLVSSLKYNLQTWAWTWSTVPESDESGGKVGSCLHCLQIKSLDGSINPQTVRHNVEKSFFCKILAFL